MNHVSFFHAGVGGGVLVHDGAGLGVGVVEGVDDLCLEVGMGGERLCFVGGEVVQVGDDDEGAVLGVIV